MLPRDIDELRQEQNVVLSLEFLFEHVDGKLIEVQSHICYHFLIVLFDALVTSAWRENGMDVEWVFTQANRHSIFLF